MNENMVQKLHFHTLYRYICQFCLSMQMVRGLDEVVFVNPPVEALPDYKLEIMYSCVQPATVQLDCVISFEMGTISTLLLTQWTCVPGNPDVKKVKLNLPDWLLYQADGIVPESHGVLSCILRASVRYRRFHDTERPVAAQDVAALQLKPFFSRPVKRHQLCPAWSKQMLQLTQEFLQKRCPYEQETVHLLSTIYASTGETFGVTKTLDPFRNELLEYLRLKAISFPWFTLSIWIFVTSYCRGSMCGVFYHIDSHNNYATPTLLLTESGRLHVQISGESEESSAFLSSFRVPLQQWCQLGVMLQGRTVTVSMTCIDEEQRTVKFTEYMLRHTAVFDDTVGYFVIGGGKFVQGVEGYFGPVVYYRNRASSHIKPGVIPDVLKNVNLTGWLQTCEEFRFEMTVKISGFLLKAKQKEVSDTCFDAFHNWTLRGKTQMHQQCEMWEKAAPHRRQAAELAKLLVFKYGRAVGLPAVGKALFSLSLGKLGRASRTAVFNRILPLLLQAGCLNDIQALHVSSVLLGAGLGVQKQHNKAWLLALLAAQKDDRLSLLRLGHLHYQGLDGVPRDPDLAYAYYANIAKQTTVDRHNPTPNQTFVEAIYLNDDETLNLQTNEDHHIFQWLKLQACRGAAEAEQALARMLFWGQQGLSPNIEEAVQHYRRGAVQLEDPVSMYDYGIVLLQGHGVERDIPKAVTFLKKAMQQNFVPAINALAWYYEQFEHDYNQAVQLWEKADLLESPDAAFNLGVMYSRGLYPGKPANQYMAYKYYLKSAERAHIKGAVQLAETWTTGIPGYVTRSPSDAVLWVKWAAEHNGYLGSTLRKALDSHLRSDMLISLFYYMVAAESGYAPAQFNVAYICEQNVAGFLNPADTVSCMWRYYNLTIQSQDPDTYAFMKMGDLLYEGCDSREKNLFSAAQMYTMAALRNNPQGWYNLALLSEGGFRLPLSVLIQLGLSELYSADNNLLLRTFYERCRDSGDADAYLPCSLALFNVVLQSFQKDYSAAIKISTTVAAVSAPIMFLVIVGVLRRRAWSIN